MLPNGLFAFTSLDVQRREGAVTRFRRTTMETLLDAPALAGRYTASQLLTTAGTGAVSLDLVVQRLEDLACCSSGGIGKFVAQMHAVFGPAHDWGGLASCVAAALWPERIGGSFRSPVMT